MVAVAEPLDVRPGDLEAWATAAGGWFEEAYRYLRYEIGFRPNPAFIGAWLSCSKDDRGSLKRIQDVADFVGISRQAVHKNIVRHQLRQWAEQLMLARMRGDHLAEVDKVTYTQAVDLDAPVAARQLYYKRAGVLDDQETLTERQQDSTLQGLLRDLREAGEPNNE